MTPEQKAAFEHSLIRVPENTFPAHEAGLERAIIQQDFLSGAQWQRENGIPWKKYNGNPVESIASPEPIEYLVYCETGFKVTTLNYYLWDRACVTHYVEWASLLTPPKTKEDGK